MVKNSDLGLENAASGNIFKPSVTVFHHDILAISETKLNSRSIINIDITQYNFFHIDSETAAGGAALYISNN